jgi:RHS repeat-associated protein
LSRVQGLISSLSSGDVAAYSYLGLSTPVQVQYPLAGVQYNLTTTSGTNLYPGLDNFGRVIDCRWQTSGGSPSDVARLQYGYDQASNRLWRLDAVAQSMSQKFDEIYSNDALYRLANMRRGQLNGAQTAINMGTLSFEQTWALDPTGNWNGITEQATGSGVTLDQARTANPVNEITAITNSVGSAWTQPGYDAAGNMTTMPQPNAPGSQFTGIFDGWQRLVKLVDPSTGETVQVNQYDGRNFRVVRETYSSGTLSETRQFYHSMSWQVLEERISGTTPDRQYTWGLRYIDDLVLRDRSTTGTLNERLYAMQDANWNVVALCNDSADVQERYAYSAYGVCSFLDASFNALSGSSCDWTVLYTGREFNAAAGLYYYRMRFYLALLGVFVSKDPIGYDGGINLYEYVGSLPISYSDPTGLAVIINARDSTEYFRTNPGNFLDRRLDSRKLNDNYTGNIGKCPECALIWVHGFANNQADAAQGAANIEAAYQKAGGKAKVYGFLWNSNPGALHFGAAQQAADQVSTGAFSKFLKDFKNSCPKTKIFLGAHSLGTRVVLNALQSAVGIMADSALLVAAAVSQNSLDNGQQYDKAPTHINNLYIAYNNNDNVLTGAYAAAENTPALGLRGVGNKNNLPKNATERDFNRNFQTNHSAVYEAKANAGFWKFYTPKLSCP